MNKRAQIVTAFAFVYVVWGSTFVAIRFAAPRMNPALLSGARFTIAALLLILFLRIKGAALRVSLAEAGKIALLSLLMFTGNTVLVNYASRSVSAGFTAVILATIPLMIAVLEAVLPSGKPMSATGWLATLAGFLGTFVMIRGGTAQLDHAPYIPCLILLLAAAAWAIGSVTAQRMKLSAGPMVISAWQMLFGGIVNLGIAGVTGGFRHTQWTGSVWAAVLYLVIFGSLASYSSYLFLLRNVPVSKVATYAYVNPLVAVALGTVLQHEPLHGIQWLGMAIVLASVAAVVTGRSSEQPITNKQPSSLAAASTTGSQSRSAMPS